MTGRPAVGAVFFELFGISVLFEGDRGFAGILFVVAEVNRIPAARVRATLAAQRLRMNREQELLRSTDADIFVVGGYFNGVEGKLGWHIARLHLDPQHATVCL